MHKKTLPQLLCVSLLLILLVPQFGSANWLQRSGVQNRRGRNEGGRISKAVPAKVDFGRRIRQQSPVEEESDSREGKSLLNTFPFNPNRQGHQQHHHDHHTQQVDTRISRQGQGGSNDVPLDIGTIAAAGERCIDKVVMVEETEYDDEILCKHSYSEHCHVTYKTDYEPQQEEECNENYKKRCYIEYKNVASQEKVQFCFTPLVRNCDIPGPIECTTEYRSECTTRYHEHEVQEDHPVCKEEQEQKCQQVTQGYTTDEQCTNWPRTRCTLQTKTVKKYTPESQCKKVPFELCGPSACPVEPGQEQCFDKSETVVQEVPEEQCSLEPQRECKQVTKLVPLLKPAEECVDIPKEICVRQRKNPRRISKPVIKKWCYTPTEESGLVPPRPRPTTTRRPPTRRPGNGFDSGNSNQGGRKPGFETQTPRGCNPKYDANYCPVRSGNRRCDQECNTAACNYDGGDCRPPPTTPPPRQGCVRGYPVDHCPARSGNRRCDQECNTRACNFDGGDCRTPPRTPPPQGCARGYPVDHCPRRRANGRCDEECNTSACGFDGGDCRPTEPPPSGYLPPRQPGYSG